MLGFGAKFWWIIVGFDSRATAEAPAIGREVPPEEGRRTRPNSNRSFRYSWSFDLYSTCDGEPKSFADHIGRKRRRLGMSRREISEQFGLVERNVRTWEDGAPLPNEETYLRLLDILDLDQESLPPALIRPSPTVLGRHIRHRREVLAMTQQELADRLRVSINAIFLWESGRALPKHRYRDRVSEFLGQNIYTLYASSPSTPPIAPDSEFRTLGDLMRRKRKELGLDQPALGRILGVTKVTISTWENGRKKPRIRYHVRLSEFLGLEVEEMIRLGPVHTT